MAAPVRFCIKKLIELRKTPLASAIKVASEQISIRSNVQSDLLTTPLWSHLLKDNKTMSSEPICYDERSIDTLQRVHRDISSSLALFTTNYSNADSETDILSNRYKIDDKFVLNTFDTLIARHGLTVETYTEAVYRTMTARGSENLNHDVIKSFLENHIGIGILLQHGYELLNQALNPPPALLIGSSSDKVGAVSMDTNLYQLVEDVKYQVTTLSEHNYNCCPDIKIESNLAAGSAPVVAIPYIVRYVLLEVLKNAVHSTVMHHSKHSETETEGEKETGADMEPVDVVISEEKPGGDVLLTVRDRGGGLDTTGDSNLIENLQRSFLHSKNICSPSDGDSQGSVSLAEELMYNRHVTYQPQSPLLAGLGVGLYLTTLYATHFGGALTLLNESVDTAGCGRCRGVTVVYRLPRNLDTLEPQLPGSGGDTCAFTSEEPSRDNNTLDLTKMTVKELKSMAVAVSSSNSDASGLSSAAIRKLKKQELLDLLLLSGRV